MHATENGSSGQQVTAEHRIYALFTHRQPYDEEIAVRFGDLPCAPSTTGEGKKDSSAERAVCAWIPDDTVAAVAGRYKDETLWQPSHRPTSDDLFAHIQTIVNGQDTQFLRRQCLTDRGLMLLNKANLYEKDKPREERRDHEVVLLLTPRASERLAARGVSLATLDKTKPKHTLALNFHRVEVFHFRTGIAITLAAIELKAIDSGDSVSVWEIQEAVATLSRFPTLRWRIARGPGAGELLAGEHFTLGDLIRSLVQGRKAKIRPSRRTFTQSFLRFERSLDRESERAIGGRLSRHYTDDYEITTDLAGLVTVQDFGTISHWIAREGAATLVHPGAQAHPPAFLLGFRTATLEENYLPIAVLNLHELAESLDITRASACWPAEVGKQEAMLTQLEAVRDRALSLRLAYRFRQVSTITMHNSLNAGFREAFGLDKLEEELTADVVEINGYLRSNIEHRKERRLRWASRLAAASLTALMSLSFFSAVEKMTKEGVTSIEWVNLALAVLVFIGAFWITWIRGGAHGHHLKEEASAKVILKKAKGDL